MKIQIILERGEDGYFVAHCPSLKSCWSQGKTREEALNDVREAIALYLEPERVDVTLNLVDTLPKCPYTHSYSREV